MSISVAQLEKSGLIIRWSPDLGPRGLVNRSLFCTRDFKLWAEQQSYNVASNRLLSPQEELEQVAALFVSGKPLSGIVNRVDPPKASGVVKLHTSSFRLFGWVPIEGKTLVLTHGALSVDTHGVKQKISTTEFGRLVIEVRKEMGVTEYATGEPHGIFRV